jgi:hypothetical protein
MAVDALDPCAERLAEFRAEGRQREFIDRGSMALRVRTEGSMADSTANP